MEEGLPWIRESEHLFGNKDLVDGYVKISGEDDTSESSNSKRKVEESLFCVMRKRICRHKSVNDDMVLDLDNAETSDDIRNFLRPESDFWFENLMENPYDPLDESSVEDNCSGSDTDLSESSEFDVIYEHILEDKDWNTKSKSLFVRSNEEEGTLVSKWSPYESKGDELLSSSPKELQYITDPQIYSGHSNVISLLHSERIKDRTSCIPWHCENILRCSVNKEDQEIPCISHIFMNDVDKASAVVEVRYGDVVNMESPMDDELRLWDIDDEPVPISVVPPDGWSSMLLETCSQHQTVGSINEDNVHDDNMGLDISSIPLTKTLETPSRPWSVCGSIGAVRNLHVVEDISCAYRSLDGQFYVNVINSEDMDAEVVQTPSALYQDEVDGEDEICFSEIDTMIRNLNLVPDDSDSCLNREEWNTSKHPRHALLEMEHCTRTSMRRAITFQGATAVLHCRDSKHFVRKRKVIIGRSSDVDIDLGKYGYGSKISRRQALVKLENNGSFSLKNLGKRHILVNGEKLDTGQIVTLTSCSSIDIRGVAFEFKINKEAVRQFLKKNNTRRKNVDDTKFRWCG